MPEYAFTFQRKTRRDIIDYFQKISIALRCDNTYGFSFRTNSITDLNRLIIGTHDGNFDISVDGNIDYDQSLNYDPFFQWLEVPNLKNINLDILSSHKDFNLFFGLISNERTAIYFDIRDHMRNSKTVKAINELMQNRINLFNKIFSELKINAIAKVGPPNPKSLFSKKYKTAVVVDIVDVKDITISKWDIDFGIFSLWFSSPTKSISLLREIFDRIRQLDFISYDRIEYNIMGKANQIASILEEFAYPIKSISNIPGRDITGNEALLNFFEKTPSFDGIINLIRYYSFQNSLTDTLLLRLRGNELEVRVNAEMLSTNTIDKFKKKISEYLAEDCLLHKKYD